MACLAITAVHGVISGHDNLLCIYNWETLSKLIQSLHAVETTKGGEISKGIVLAL